MSGFRISSLKDGKYFAIEDDWEDEYRGESGRFFTVREGDVYMEQVGKLQMTIYEFVSQFSPEEIIKVED